MDIYFIEVGSFFLPKKGSSVWQKGGRHFSREGEEGGGLSAFKLVKNIHG